MGSTLLHGAQSCSFSLCSSLQPPIIPTFLTPCILYFVDCASLYNLVNKANLVHNFFSVFISLYFCDTWYLLFCMDDCLVCWVECIPDSYPYRITSTKCGINTVVSPDDGHIVAQNM